MGSRVCWLLGSALLLSQVFVQIADSQAAETEETKLESGVAGAASQEAQAAEAHKLMEAWLEHYFATEGDPYASARLKKAGAAAAVRADGVCVLDSEKRVPRDNLVIVPVGDHFDRRIWLNAPGAASWDLILIHYGNGTTQSCPECKKVYRAKGAKWRLHYMLFKSPDWEGLRRQYRAVMLPDADLVLDTCTINRAFAVFHEYSLLMAQPSLCEKSWSYWKILSQKPQNILRFVTFNEIMAPIFRMDMYNGLVGPSLYNAHTGWGLDMLWPFKLRYPKASIGVIDDICMHHVGSTDAGDSVYNADMPFDKNTEWRMRWEEFNLTEQMVKEMGLPFQPVEELGAVPKRLAKDRRSAGAEEESFVASLRLRTPGVPYPVLVGLLICIPVAACALLARLRPRQYAPCQASDVRVQSLTPGVVAS